VIKMEKEIKQEFVVTDLKSKVDFSYIVRNMFQDRSAILLLVSNLVTIGMALLQDWNAATVLWTYWVQSVLVGGFNALRIFTLKEFSTEGFKGNGKPLPPTRATQVSTGIFFMFHYGFFHVVYAIFLASLLDDVSVGSVLLGGLVFLINHAYSFFFNRHEDEEKVPNLGRVMFRPYSRILPMHLTIIFCGFFLGTTAGLIFFFVVKTVVDLLSHAVEHGKNQLSNKSLQDN
jgi:hypothetical protein